MKFADLKEFLDLIAPPHLSFEWDSDGVEVCFDNAQKIEKILLCLDITSDIIEYAHENNYNSIISHHPMIYDGIKKLDYNNLAAAKAIKLAAYGISAVSMHTKFDSAENGVNDALISVLGINYKIKEMFGNSENNQIGRIITLEQPCPVTEVADTVKSGLSQFYKVHTKMPVDIKIHCTGDNLVSRIAVIGGSGGSFIENAINAGADTFLTGEIKYDRLVAAADLPSQKGHKMNYITAGHYATEAVVLPSLKKRLEDKFPGIRADMWFDGRWL